MSDMTEAWAPWRPALGAWPESRGIRFRVWAPEHREVELVLEGGTSHPMVKGPDGTFGAFVTGAGAGALYRYRLDGGALSPTPPPGSSPRVSMVRRKSSIPATSPGPTRAGAAGRSIRS